MRVFNNTLFVFLYTSYALLSRGIKATSGIFHSIPRESVA